MTLDLMRLNPSNNLLRGSALEAQELRRELHLGRALYVAIADDRPDHGIGFVQEELIEWDELYGLVRGLCHGVELFCGLRVRLGGLQFCRRQLLLQHSLRSLVCGFLRESLQLLLLADAHELLLALLFLGVISCKGCVICSISGIGSIVVPVSVLIIRRVFRLLDSVTSAHIDFLVAVLELDVTEF